MRPSWGFARAVGIGAILVAGAGCHGAMNPPATYPVTLHGEVIDPIGDAIPSPGSTAAPDLVHGIVKVSAGNVSFAIEFAPGSFDGATTRVTIQLDTDLSPSTGIQAQGLGIDYIVDMWPRTKQATISGAVPNALCTATDPCYRPIGRAPLALVTNGMSTVVPLSLLGDATGRLDFRVLAYVSIGNRPATVSDYMPDLPLPPGTVR